MISFFYAIADASGNIYLGTFAKEPWRSKFLHIMGGYYGECNIEKMWPHFSEKGDHVVYCKIETSENLIIKMMERPDKICVR